MSISESKLKETEIYSLSTLQELRDQRFRLGFKFYVFVLKESNRTYLFDASKYIENCIRNRGLIRNPYTRIPTTDFEIHVSTMESPDFQLYMTKETLLTYPNHLPIHWNDPDVPLQDRLSLMVKYAQFFERTHPHQALQTYIEAAAAGSTYAKVWLAQKYSKENNKELAVKYLKDCLEVEDLSTSNLLACATLLRKFQEFPLALEAYTLAAKRGDRSAIASVITYLEAGAPGIERDVEEAAKWREKLPEAWRSSPMPLFFKHLIES